MKTRNILKKLPCFALFFSALAMSSCIKEQVENVPAEKTGEFTFLIRVPGNAAPSTAAGTRAITEGGTNDNRVDAVDILLFDASTEKFVRSVYCMNINETGDVKVKSVRARLPQGSYKAVILANSHQQLIAHPVSEGTLKATALAQFTETLAYGTSWNSLPGSADYRDFPMWGEVSGTVTVPTAGTITVDLYRMLAKVNLSLAYTETTPGTPDFVLKDIRVYNYNQSGYLAPADANWASNPKQPTHYASREYPANQATPTALLYDNTTGTNASRTPKYITTDAAGKFYKSVDEIFIFESPADNSAWSWEKNTCLVLGGEYMGVMGYYRIDFMQSNVNIDILRNHSYNFSVEAVRNQGYDSPEEALRNRPENMLYNIVVWDEHDITDIVFDGQYYLGVSQNAFELTREARSADDEDNKLKIRTDVPTGWTAAAWNNLAGDVSVVLDGTTGNPWLRISPVSGDGTDAPANEMTLEMDANESGAERTAYIHIAAGRLTYVVKVTQTLASNLSLILRHPVTLVEFQEYTWIVSPDATPEDVRFDLLWGPRTSDVFISNVKGEAASSGTFIFDQSAGYKYIVPGNSTLQGGQANSGKESYKIRPTTVTTTMLNADPWYDKSSKIEFTVNDGASGILKKTIVLRNWYPNAFAETEDVYIMDGSSGNTFTIKANADFTVEIASESGNNPTAGDGNPVVTLDNPASTVYTANTAGTAIGFTIADDMTTPTVNVTYVKLIIKSPTNLFADKEVTLFCVAGIIQPESNSYIVATGSTPILIPVSRANASGLGTQIGDGVAYTTELLWAENTGGVVANGNVSLLTPAGTGPNGYVLVKPGTVQGNALVAAKVGAKIVWSWHIWVLNSNNMPQNIGGMMDRDIGALRTTYATPGAVSDGVLGFVYQWGRKDPLFTVTTGSLTKVVRSGSLTTEGTATTNTYAYAVANPTTNITNWTGAVWTGANAVHDPCPVGWRTGTQAEFTTLPNFTGNFANALLYSTKGGTYPGFWNASYRHWFGRLSNVVGTWYIAVNTLNEPLYNYYNTVPTAAMKFPVRCVKK